MYAAIAVLAIALGWLPVGIIFGIGALALGIAWMSTESTAPEAVQERAKPDWVLAMDDPDAPDLSLPEYRTKPRTASDGNQGSPFDRPPGGAGPDEAGARTNPSAPDPPTPGAR